MPADLFVERLSGAAALGTLALQALWAAVLLAAARWLVGVATRRVITQGG